MSNPQLRSPVRAPLPSFKFPYTPPTPDAPTLHIARDPVLRQYRDGPKIPMRNVLPPDHVKVGPFAVGQVSDYTLANVVGRDRVPVVLYEARMDDATGRIEERYAVLAPPDKNLRIVCAGCYWPGMSLFHTYDGVMGPRTFYGHFEMTDPKGPKPSRKRPCRVHDHLEPLDVKMRRMASELPESDDPSLSHVNESDLLEELRSRPGGLEAFMPHFDIETLVKEIETRTGTPLTVVRETPVTPVKPVSRLSWTELLDEMERRHGRNLERLTDVLLDHIAGYPNGRQDIAARAMDLNPALGSPVSPVKDAAGLSTQTLLDELESRPGGLAALLPLVPDGDVLLRAMEIDLNPILDRVPTEHLIATL